MPQSKRDIISQLQKDILQWGGYRPAQTDMHSGIGLGPMEKAFPNGIFPLGAVHELICGNSGQAAATTGFVTGLLSVLMRDGGVCLWVGLSQAPFAAALKAFGIEPDQVIFLNVWHDREVLWVLEEALKCQGLAAVVGEVQQLDFKQSRRLQLAVEQSQVTGFVMRNLPKKLGSTACAARWQVKPLPSVATQGLPGLGLPRWQVELLKVRNGQPGRWVLEWEEGKFAPVLETPAMERNWGYG